MCSARMGRVLLCEHVLVCETEPHEVCAAYKAFGAIEQRACASVMQWVNLIMSVVIK